MKLDHCLNTLLVSGLDDWVQAAEVASVARMEGGAKSEEALRDISLTLIRHLLEQELMEAGTIIEKEGFAPWGVPVNEAMNRITHDWPAGSRSPELGGVCWLNLTAKGQVQAEQINGKGTRHN